MAFFHAPDDAAALAVRGVPLVLECPPGLAGILAEVERFLTDRDDVDVLGDERHLAVISEVDLFALGDSVTTVTDSLRDALVAADAPVLAAAVGHWPIAGELAVVARAAAGAGGRVYVVSSWQGGPDGR